MTKSSKATPGLSVGAVSTASNRSKQDNLNPRQNDIIFILEENIIAEVQPTCIYRRISMIFQNGIDGAELT